MHGEPAADSEAFAVQALQYTKPTEWCFSKFYSAAVPTAVDSRLPVSGLNWPPEWGTLSLWSLISLIYISKCLNFWSWVHLVQELVENQLLGRQSGLVGPAISQIDPASRGGVGLVPGWGTLGF